jgi:3-methylcrotonyl-CoA carboxylase alpha subunit
MGQYKVINIRGIMFNKILIANRGEIACRIAKTARKMGIESVAVYSTADRDSLHVSLADSAFCIGQPPARDSYLNIDTIVAQALACGAQAIHPGYGFLSENPQMARACAAAGLIFIGPTVAAMEAMASKQLAKQLLEKTKVPLTPGYHGKEQSDEKLLIEAQRLGFPVLLKAACGGGGKGMRAVHHEADFFKDLASARREAKASFADDTMLIEKLISNPRHIEIQIMADNHGNVVHLYERDCSIQRRHQKIIEEAPAPNLSETLRQGLADAAVAVAHKIEYRGAGTVEFLVDSDQHFYFMEMNTRLQVEHPVTEMITGLDLVEWQLRIAAGEPLVLTQKQIHAHGHAIECRIYAEDPQQGFIPSMGQLHFLREPIGDGIRLDSGVTQRSEITMYYDPMMAKLIAWGDSREQALLRLQQALQHYHIGGVKTNIPFLQSITNHPNFIAAQLSTDFLTQNEIKILTPDKQLALLLAASFDYLNTVGSINDSLCTDTFAWQMHLSSHWISRYFINGEQHNITVTPINHHELTVSLDHKTITLRIKLSAQQLIIDDGQQRFHALVENTPNQLRFHTKQGPITVDRFNWQHLAKHDPSPNTQLTAPMPATVVAILKNKGDTIKAGDRLMVLEAMKMEHAIHAPNDGLLVDIFYDIGAQVNEGAELVAIIGHP